MKRLVSICTALTQVFKPHPRVQMPRPINFPKFSLRLNWKVIGTTCLKNQNLPYRKTKQHCLIPLSCLQGQTPLFLGCREGSIQTVRHLLVNYANRKLADNMDMTPEDIAKQRHHLDIVELLTDWSLGCNSPKAVPAPTSPPEGQLSPLASMASPSATSPPTVEIHNGGGPAMVAHFQAARPKSGAVNRSQGTPRPRPNASGSNNNNNTKRKRKKARPNENAYPVMNTVTTLSPTATLSPTNNVATSCATGPAFSPNCLQIANGLSPLGSAGISPADSTTLSPLQAPNSLDTQPPSPLEILSPDDLAGLEEVQIDCWDELDLVDPFSEPTDMSICGLPPSTTIGQVGVMDHIVPTTSDCMYVLNNAPPVRRADPLAGQRLYSVQSTPDLHCGGLQHNDSRPIVFNGRTCSSAQKASITTPSQLASYQAITNSNLYDGGGHLIPQRKDYYHNDYPMQQPLQLQNQLVLGQMPVRSFMNGPECVSPQKHLSFPTPSPDSPGQWSSSSSSSSC